MKIVKFNKGVSLIFEKSNIKNKKYKVKVDSKYTIHFGHTKYQHYKDKIGLYSNLDHNDKKRRTDYRRRASKIKNKQGAFTYKIPYTSNWFAYNFLW